MPFLLSLFFSHGSATFSFFRPMGERKSKPNRQWCIPRINTLSYICLSGVLLLW
jgi:hypothetical protein